MNKLKEILQMGLLMANMETHEQPLHSRRQEIHHIPDVPKDAKHNYFFMKDGCYTTYKNENTVFSCRAINQGSAVRKFNKYKSTI